MSKETELARPPIRRLAEYVFAPRTPLAQAHVDRPPLDKLGALSLSKRLRQAMLKAKRPSRSQ